MYLLINEEEMQVIAKHPNFATMHELGIIMCADDCAVFPLDMHALDSYTSAQLELLYLSITDQARFEYPSLPQLRRLLLAYINEMDETILNKHEVSAQAQYAIDWGLEGVCSFAKGAKEPSLDEGLWEYPTVIESPEWEDQQIAATAAINFKPSKQVAFVG